MDESMRKAVNIVKGKTKDRSISKSDIAKVIRKLLKYGFSLAEAVKIVDRLIEAATLNNP